MTKPAPRAAAADDSPDVGLRLAAAIYFALSLLYFIPAFLPGSQLFGTDYIQGSYFYLEFIAQRNAGGELAKWIPFVYGGLPLHSNPGSTFYPLRWVSELLLPTSMLFPFLFWFQFGMAGLGTYLLCAELGCRRWVAFVAGLAFQWAGITTSWVYAGHDGRIIVATLTPLLFFFLRRGIRTGALAPFAGAAATTGFALLSFQIQNAYYMLLGAAFWAVFSLVQARAQPPARLARTVALGVGAVAFGFAMAAVNFLPFTDYVAESPRGQTGGRGYEYSTSYSMPPRAILGVAVPEQVGATIQDESGAYVFPVYRGENAFRLHTEYVGALVMVLLALGVAYGRRVREWWFFAGLALFALSLALGGNTPLYRLYYEVLPGLKRFRAPDLAYFLMAFSLVVMAAVTLERLAALRDEARARRAAAPEALARVLWIAGGVAVAALAGAVLFGGPAAPMAEGTAGLTPAQGWLRFGVFAGMVAAVLWMWTAGRMASRGALVALSLITVVDLWVIGKKFMMTVDAPDVIYAQDDIIAFLTSQPQRGRVWPVPGGSAWPAYINYPMRFGLELVYLSDLRICVQEFIFLRF